MVVRLVLALFLPERPLPVAAAGHTRLELPPAPAALTVISLLLDCNARGSVVLNPDHETSLRHRFDTVSLAASREILGSGKRHRPGPNGHWLAAEPEHFPGPAVERDVTDVLLAVSD